jgi:hypothetical protein
LRKFHFLDSLFDPINSKNYLPPKAVEIVAWIKENKPEVIERMKESCTKL